MGWDPFGLDATISHSFLGSNLLGAIEGSIGGANCRWVCLNPLEPENRFEKVA